MPNLYQFRVVSALRPFDIVIFAIDINNTSSTESPIFIAETPKETKTTTQNKTKEGTSKKVSKPKKEVSDK